MRRTLPLFLLALAALACELFVPEKGSLGQPCLKDGICEAGLACHPVDRVCTPCGNGQLDEGEACDGANLNGESCESLGLWLGELSCSPDCQFDTSPCLGDAARRRVELPEQCTGPLDLDLGVYGEHLLLAHGCTAGLAAVHEAPRTDPLAPFELRKRLSRNNPTHPAPALVFGTDGEFFAGDALGEVLQLRPIAGSDPLDWEVEKIRTENELELDIQTMSFDPVSGALALADLDAQMVETRYWPQPETSPIVHFFGEENFSSPMLCLLVLSESETGPNVLMGMDASGGQRMGVIAHGGIRLETLPHIWDTFEQGARVAHMAFQPGSLFAAFAVDTGERSFIRLYDLDYYPWDPQSLTYGSAAHSRIAFTGQSNDLLAGTEDGRLLLYETVSAEPLLDIAIAESPVRALAVSEDSAWAATWCEGEHFIQVWNMDLLYELAETP